MEIDGKKITFSQRTQSELTGFGTGGNVWNGVVAGLQSINNSLTVLLGAIVLCKYLEKQYGGGKHNDLFKGKTVFEIGSGTGVAGIACAQLMKGARFILSDQIQVLPLIKENLEVRPDHSFRLLSNLILAKLDRETAS